MTSVQAVRTLVVTRSVHERIVVGIVVGTTVVGNDIPPSLVDSITIQTADFSRIPDKFLIRKQSE